MPRISFLSASNKTRSLISNAQRCINLYPEIGTPDAAAPLTFYGTPGRKLWSTVPGLGSIRGLYETSKGQLFAARGSGLYRYIGTEWVYVAAMGNSNSQVSAVDNGLSAVFVDGSLAAPTFNLTTMAVGAMSGEGWYGSDYVDFLNGFLIFNRPGTGQFYWSGAYELTLDPLDFATGEATPDKVVRAIRDHNEIWLFGEKSIDVFSPSGSSATAFEAISGAVQETGCAAAGSVAKMDNTLYWLGNDKRGSAMIWRANGYSPARTSTHALEEEMRRYPRLDDAIAYSYQQAGHSFYVITFPTAKKTWAYDAATQLWAERAYRTEGNQLEQVRDSCHVFYQRKHLVGDRENGNIYELDPETYTDNGAVIQRIKSFQHISQANVMQFFRRITLDMQAGIGNELELDPQVWLRWSDDGGNTWSSPLVRSLGKAGEYSLKPFFDRLGRGRDRIFEVSTTAIGPVTLQGAFLDLDLGT
jgi:hypothetical protein